MSKNNLTDQILEAAANMREMAADLVEQIDQSVEFIIESTDQENAKLSLKAFREIKSLRYLRNQISAFIEKEE